MPKSPKSKNPPNLPNLPNSPKFPNFLQSVEKSEFGNLGIGIWKRIGNWELGIGAFIHSFILHSSFGIKLGTPCSTTSTTQQ